MGIVIGIDLGTTTSEIAYLNNGKPMIIPNKMGDRITPSAVGLNKEYKIVVAKQAKRLLIATPEKVILEVKRKMGSEETIWLGDKEYKPQQISAMILKYLKESAEEFLHEKITEAVITVPAMFDNLQRQATKDAAEIAGLKVERIINEPTAAALAYGLENIGVDEKVLVYDLGGGTFDVTILEMYDGILDVKVSRGDNKLGGKDFDERIMEYVFDEIVKKHSIDLRKNKAAVAKIKEFAEIAKIDLTVSDTSIIEIPSIASFAREDGSPIPIEVEISRTQFDLLIQDLVDRTEKIVDDALQACNLTEKDINSVIIVGGSTRVPCVKALLKRKFGDKFTPGINPDEVVALGAAVQAGIKTGQFGEENNILITDVCQYSMGTSVISKFGGRLVNGMLDILIEKDTTIPYSCTKTYTTARDNQDTVKIDVYQGDDPMVENDILIGDFDLDGIPPSPAGEQGVEVTFSYDINGILKVDATIISTGKKRSEIFNLKSMSNEQIEMAKKDLDDAWKSSALLTKVKGLLETAEKLMASMSNADRSKVKPLIDGIKRALINEDEKTLLKLEAELTDLLFDMK